MPDLSRITCACLAAGLSSRMGGEHKLLKILNDQPVLRLTLESLDRFSFAQKILIVGHRAEELCAIAAPTGFTAIVNSRYATGLHSSIRAAVLNVPTSSDAVMIYLADQPFEISQTLAQFFSKVGIVTTQTLARAWSGSVPGHPVLIGRDHFARILREPDSDSGCNYLFKENDFLKIELGMGAVCDLDTPEHFAQADRKRAIRQTT